jgi:hypothetical protein
VPDRRLVRAAALSNAEWCHAFTRTHGIEGLFRVGLWSSAVRTPPHYPDAVTLLPEASVEDVLPHIDVSEGCSVKDSFDCLDLGAAGFETLFRAEWVARPPAVGHGAAPREWSPVTTVGRLREWENVWGEPPGGSGFFRPALLQSETIVVLARHEGDRIVAGAIANRSADVIGLGNLFDAAGDLVSAWEGAAEAATSLWDAMPAVGYDSGDALDAAHQAGFVGVGELAVWHYPAPASADALSNRTDLALSPERGSVARPRASDFSRLARPAR